VAGAFAAGFVADGWEYWGSPRYACPPGIGEAAAPPLANGLEGMAPGTEIVVVVIRRDGGTSKPWGWLATGAAAL
jgi:hypothetical protein